MHAKCQLFSPEFLQVTPARITVIGIGSFLQFISSICQFRKKLDSSFHETTQNEKWADDSFYAYTRGDDGVVLVATTNQGSGSDQQRHIPNLPYKDGQGKMLL